MPSVVQKFSFKKFNSIPVRQSEAERRRGGTEHNESQAHIHRVEYKVNMGLIFLWNASFSYL